MTQSERTQEVGVKGYIHLAWKDEYRVWNNTFPLLCLDSLILPHGKESGMWLPDVAIVSDDFFYQLPKSRLYPIRVKSSGDVDFSPGGIIQFQCEMNLRLFPFDSMLCKSRIESWFYPINRQKFDKNKSKIVMVNITEHEQWTIESYNLTFDDVYYETSGFTYGTILFKLSLRRKSGYFMMNVVIPSGMLSVLELVTFILPANQVIRIQVSFLLLLAYTMFLAVIQADLPKSADQTPLLTIYIILMIWYIAAAIAIQCFVMNLVSKSAKASKLPKWLESKDTKKKERPDDENNNQWPMIDSNFTADGGVGSTETEEVKREKKLRTKLWKRFAVTIDRLGAVAYLFLMTLTTVVLLVVIPLFYNESLQ